MTVAPSHNPAAESARPDRAPASKRNAPTLSRGVWSVLLAIILPVSVIVLWQMAGAGGSLFGGVLPTPEGVWDAWYTWAFGPAGMGLNPYSGTWWSNVLFSTQRVVQGFAVAIVVGIPLGILIGRAPVPPAPRPPSRHRQEDSCRP
jgi:NitT/TauT family transport system permease protein